MLQNFGDSVGLEIHKGVHGNKCAYIENRRTSKKPTNQRKTCIFCKAGTQPWVSTTPKKLRTKSLWTRWEPYHSVVLVKFLSFVLFMNMYLNPHGNHCSSERALTALNRLFSFD